MKNYLEFEKEIKNLETEMDKLKSPFGKDGITEVDTNKIKVTEEEINSKLKSIYSNLNSWQKTLVARHEDRPRANFYIKNIFSSFTPLSGDRYFGDDKSVTAGFGLIGKKSVLIIGQEKGEDLNSRIERNFGMMRPEGYRKSIRLMELANKFNIPIISFIDTPGAYPGVGAEERGQARAIAENIYEMFSLKTPIISLVIGEGGSGGALGIGIGDKVAMMENAWYSVISPEGCASILWRSAEGKEDAAEALKLTAPSLLELGIVDEVVPEPVGGAHSAPADAIQMVGDFIERSLVELQSVPIVSLLERRHLKFRQIAQRDGALRDGVDVENVDKPRKISQTDSSPGRN